MGIAIADKPDSQDICFVPSGNYAALVEKLRPEATQPGIIRHVDGRELGRHDGIIRYTIGQRRGLGIASRDPLYVVRIDAGTREVVVGPREALAARGLALPAEGVVEKPYTHTGGREGLREVMAAREKPTAVICGNDVLAIGAIAECHVQGLAVPEDVSVTGFDDMEIAAMMRPALTRIWPSRSRISPPRTPIGKSRTTRATSVSPPCGTVAAAKPASASRMPRALA